MARPCLIVGHRGARGLFPENTLTGFAGALALGVDALEMDVTLTADGVAVVSHDPALNPNLTRDKTGAWLAAPGPPIRALNFAELAQWDVGRLCPHTAYAAQFAEQQPSDGESIPALAAVFSRHPAARFIIELKSFPDRAAIAAAAPAIADAVLSAADTAGVTTQIAIEAFDWRGPRHVRRHRPEVQVAWLTRAETVHAAEIWWDGPHPADFGGSVPRAVAAEGGPVWAPDHSDLTREQIDEAHALGLLVIPWTVNDAADMERLHLWGVDGVVTDRPDRALVALRRT